MKTIYFFIIAYTAFVNKCTAQYTWNGSISNDYQVPANWTPARTAFSSLDVLNFNTLTNINIVNVPNQTIEAITVSGGVAILSLEAENPSNILSLNGAAPLIFNTNGSVLASTFLTIRLNNTSAFTMNTGTFGIAPGTGGKIILNSAVTLAGGALNFDVAGTGGTTINGSVTYTSGIFSCNNASAITWTNGANYFHALNGSSIPVSNWQSGSTCTITGTTNTVPAGFGVVNFANLAWNCTTQSTDIDWLPAATVVNINGTLTIASTNISKLRVVSTGNATINAGAYIQSGGYFVLQSTAVTATTTLSVSGDFLHSAGNIDAVDGSSPGTAIISMKKAVTKESAAAWRSSSNNVFSQMIFQFSGSAAQTVVINGFSAWLVPIAGRCNIIVSNANGISLTGGLKVVNTNSSQPATLTMAGGIITGGSSVVYSGSGSGGTSLIYAGNNFQTASAIEFPTSSGPANLTINNTLGVSFPASFKRTIPGTLTMIAGNFALGTDTLSLTNPTLANQLNYTGGYITTGTLSRTFPASGLPTSVNSTSSLFPFGSGANNRALNIFFSSAALSGGSAGIISVSHTTGVGIVAIAPTITDNGISLDKRSITNWSISTSGGFNLGSTTASLSAVAANIGSVDILDSLRLTDGATNYGNLINTTGSNSDPVVGKSALVQADINKTLYIGSSDDNPLVIITFTWTGASGIDGNWIRASNWSGGVGYPSASTENAIITNTAAPFQPKIKTGTSINVYQLTVGAGMSLTMEASSGINVFDNVNFSGLASFDPSSTFGYASTSVSQNILALTYGNINVSGLAQKILPNSSLTIMGSYSVSGYMPDIGTNTFIYAGSGAQRIGAANYYNLSITGNRSGAEIALGNGTVANTINIKNIFDVNSLINFTVRKDFNTIDFSSSSSQNIPGFIYNIINNSANGPRILDPLGSSDVQHIITCLIFSRFPGAFYTVTNSKIKYVVSGLGNATFKTGPDQAYHDLEISGDLKNYSFNYFDGELYIAGKYVVSLTNYKQTVNDNVYIYYNGIGDQTITGYQTSTSTNTPVYQYPNIIVQGGNRNINLSSTDTIPVTGSFQVPRSANYAPVSRYNTIPTVFPFSSGKGFIVAGSTVSFSRGSGLVPNLLPASGINNYENLAVSSGSRILESNNMTIGGNLFISGNDTNFITLASPAVLKIGDASTSRIFNVLGNVTITGAGATMVTGQLDLNTGTAGSTTLNVSKSLIVGGRGQITSTGASNGNIVFKGILPHTYSNTSLYKNGMVNFKIGDGVIPNSKLTLLSSLDLVRSVSSPTVGTLDVFATDSLDCSIYNITSNTINGTSGNAKFDLHAGATLITANKGGIEGIATGSLDGSITNDATLTKTYDPTASYVYNASAATNMSFPAASTPFPMANLTIGDSINTATFTLNKSINVYNVLSFKKNAGFELSNFNLTLKSTAANTSRVEQVPSVVSINYSGTGRFVVERYFPALRSWRLITSPLSTHNTTTTIFNEWQNSGNNSPGLGTFVTGPNPNFATNGLDASGNNAYSMRGFQNNAYSNIGNTLVPLSGTALSAANIGYFMFVRGDRTLSNLVIPNSSNTTFSSKGKLQYGTQTFPAYTRTIADGAARKFTLIGNPYPSPINFNSLGRANLIKRFVIWDPKLATVGAFVTFDDLNNDNLYSQDIPSPGGQDLNIQSSQAFFVETDAAVGASSITFDESSKTTVNNLNIFRPASPSAVNSSFRSILYFVNSDNSTKLVDGNLAEFSDNFNNVVDLQDALKFSNVNETFALFRNNTSIAMERRQPITIADTLFFNLLRTTQRNYRFEFQPVDFDPSLIAFIEDNYLGTRTLVNLLGSTTYDFSISRDVKSAMANRFRIVFSTVPLETLPVSFQSIKAYQQGAAIAVEWKVENEINIQQYDLEKSTDGVNFTKVSTLLATAESGSKTYSILDLNVLQGNNFYRIVSNSRNGSVAYSSIVKVIIGKPIAGISIYPNPVNANSIGVAFVNMEKGIYQLRLMNTVGQILLKKQLNHTAGSSMETITPISKLNRGIYQLEVTTPHNINSTIKVIVQ